MTTLVDHKGGDVDRARLDPALALVSMFRPIYRGRRPGGLSIEHQHDGNSIKFNIWRGLDARDQSILLAVVGLAGMLSAVGETSNLHANIPHPNAQELWSKLEPEDNAVLDRTIVIKTTRYAILQASGLENTGPNYGSIEDCLERLSMVGCRVRSSEGYDWSMRLLSYRKTPEGQMHIALNSRIAKALSGHNVRLCLIERQSLHGDVQQLAHAWLSGWLRHGSSNTIRLDKLAEKVWGPPSTSDATNRKRRERISKALHEIASALPGWCIDFSGRGVNAKATIKRPVLLEHTRTRSPKPSDT